MASGCGGCGVCVWCRGSQYVPPSRELARPAPRRPGELGDVDGDWRLQYAGKSERVVGRLSGVLLKAAGLSLQHREVKVVDAYGGASFIVRGGW